MSRLTSTVAVLVALLVAACAAPDDLGQAPEPDAPDDAGQEDLEEEDAGQGDAGPDDPAVLRLYTSVTEETVEAVTAAFEERQPDVELEVFRAPTGELNARVAAERREGEIQADIFWLTDPLSMQPFAEEGLLRSWTPDAVDSLPAVFSTDTFWGTRLLNLVIVAHSDLDDPPTAWSDLADPDHVDDVGFPDPGFAGSAFGALGYFALEDEFGFDFYEALVANGLTQVDAPGEVVAGVAEGRFDAGMTLDQAARNAVEAGSPIELIWPEPGAIVVDSPIAVLDHTAAPQHAEAFVEFVLSVEAQEHIAATGWQPVHPDATWPHEDGPTVAPDWEASFERHDELLEEYRALIGG